MYQHTPGAAPQPQRRLPQQSVLSRLPVPDLLQSHFVRPAYYTVTVVDGHGRIAATSPLRTLGWTPGTVLAFGVDANRLITVTRTEGSSQPANTAPRREIGPRGHLNLPATTRRRAGIVTGDRLLIAADTNTDILWVLPPQALALILHVYTTGQDQQP